MDLWRVLSLDLSFVFHSYTLLGLSWEFECALPSPSLQFGHQAWQELSTSLAFTNMTCPPQSVVSGISLYHPASTYHGVWQFACSMVPEAYHTTQCRWSGWLNDHFDSDIDISLINTGMVIVGLRTHLAGGAL